ncbi:MAG: hypothetical protein Q9195_003985 [Heterodermia aff. obscurata]
MSIRKPMGASRSSTKDPDLITRTKASVSTMFNNAQSKLSSIDPKQAARDTGTWIHDHPYQSAFYGTTGLIVAVPALVAAPALGAAGFGANGVVIGSAAAASQGPAVAAGSLFATLTSAGAGGYGVPIIYGAVQGVAASTGGVVAGVNAWMKWKKAPKSERSKEGDTAEEEEEIDGEETIGSQAPESRNAKL